MKLRLTQMINILIYCGTFLLSALSFYTTYRGLTILLPVSLAAIGAFGIQASMLGVAWKLMKARENRHLLLTVFATAAVFSIFFSYASFDTALKSTTRGIEVRLDFARAARPILDSYNQQANEALERGRYQANRISTLVKLELTKGWSTMADEGSGDPYLQNVVEGAREMVASWKENTGKDYSQGTGRGIIVEYLENHRSFLLQNLARIADYTARLDTARTRLSGHDEVAAQFAVVNAAWTGFPASEIGAILNRDVIATPPPEPAAFVEQARSRHQAFMMVISDLIDIDYLTAFSLALATAVDAIVILLALAGSLNQHHGDLLLRRVEMDTAARINTMPIDDAVALRTHLRNTVDRIEVARQYGREIERMADEYYRENKPPRLRLFRGPETLVREIDTPKKPKDDKLDKSKVIRI